MSLSSALTNSTLNVAKIQFNSNSGNQIIPFIGSDQLFSGAYTSAIPSSANATVSTQVLNMLAPNAGLYIMTGNMIMTSTSEIQDLLATISYAAGTTTVWNYLYRTTSAAPASHTAVTSMNIACIFRITQSQTLYLEVAVQTDDASPGSVSVANLHLTQLA